jgi:hypothetical protein
MKRLLTIAIFLTAVLAAPVRAETDEIALDQARRTALWW